MLTWSERMFKLYSFLKADNRRLILRGAMPAAHRGESTGGHLGVQEILQIENEIMQNTVLIKLHSYFLKMDKKSL